MTYVYTEGSDVIIPCTFSGAPISNVTWQRENEVVMWTQNSNGPLTLSIKNVSRKAAGNYTCSATVNFKGVYTASESFILVVECKFLSHVVQYEIFFSFAFNYSYDFNIYVMYLNVIQKLFKI